MNLIEVIFHQLLNPPGHALQPQRRSQCNYDNDYYGDRMCR
ncbi:hypothetical protein GCM10011297_27130 [Bacterioplanes sanyensis]|nr:hypothetical protein [Bacterioplanes sanyensis]GGY52895.1 hypothetical protein GCM10011297_27130 [Bacterioplanes sanyensis]